MENVSKALLIAGGILIGLLVFSIIIYNYSLVSNYVEQIFNKKEQSEMIMYNEPFVKFENREDITAQEIVSLINYIEKHEINYSNVFVDNINFFDDINKKDFLTKNMPKKNIVNEEVKSETKDEGKFERIITTTTITTAYGPLFKCTKIKYIYGEVTEIRFEKSNDKIEKIEKVKEETKEKNE